MCMVIMYSDALLARVCYYIYSLMNVFWTRNTNIASSPGFPQLFVGCSMKNGEEATNTVSQQISTRVVCVIKRNGAQVRYQRDELTIAYF